MFTRTALMFAVVASLCGAAFSLGGKSSAVREDSSGIPPEHAVMLALHYQRELGLKEDQLQNLNSLHDEMEKEFAPLRSQAESLQHQLMDLQQSGKPDPETVKKLQQEGDAVGAKMQPMFDKYAQEVGKLLSDEQRQKLMKFSNATGHPADGPEFVLNTIIQSRDALGITPQQFTKLQYLQSDFIRAFAPIREKMELLQIDVQEKFAKVGKVPTPEYSDQAFELQKQGMDLQTQFSEQAIKDVLEPKQRTKLGELRHGDHRSAPNGG